MSERKTPILLRQSGLSRRIMALHRYTRKTVRGRDVIDAGTNGKQDVTADFDALMLNALFGDDGVDEARVDSGMLTSALDGVASGRAGELDGDEIRMVGRFRENLVRIIDRHNSTGHGTRSSGTEATDDDQRVNCGDTNSDPGTAQTVRGLAATPGGHDDAEA